MYKKYRVKRASRAIKPSGQWDGPDWVDVEPIDIKEYMGQEEQFKPKTQAKLLYDDNFVYVIFRVEDKYVRAVAQKNHDPVCNDSCVEFFFTPGTDISKGYFNIEVNCGGVILSRHQTAPMVNRNPLTAEEFERFQIYHSEPKMVEPEKQEPTTWIVEYRVPIDVLEKRCPVDRPAPGITWRANFYKCGSQTSHPHWLTWSVVDNPKPKFHMPEFFGTLEFV